MLAELVSFLFLSEFSNNKEGPQCGPAVLTTSCQTLKKGWSGDWVVWSNLFYRAGWNLVILKDSMTVRNALRYFQSCWCNHCCCCVVLQNAKLIWNITFSCTSSLPTMKNIFENLVAVCMFSHHILSELIILYMLVIKQILAFWFMRHITSEASQPFSCSFEMEANQAGPKIWLICFKMHEEGLLLFVCLSFISESRSQASNKREVVFNIQT